MRDPKLIQIGRAGGPALTITHVAHVVSTAQKSEWLGDFLRLHREPSLVFVRTKRFADKLAAILAGRGIRCAALHADRTQADRTAAVEGFRAGKHRVLVATDIAARGLDIDGIVRVVNYEVPFGADAYVHRAGRTGRAEATGTALTLVAPDELPMLRAIEQSIGITITDLQPSDPTSSPARVVRRASHASHSSHAAGTEPLVIDVAPDADHAEAVPDGAL
jgi:ATP-dependent RNA helicase RhlE